MSSNDKTSIKKSLKDTHLDGKNAENHFLIKSLAFLTLIICIFTIWLVPRPIGDLYIALAAGRDILSGNFLDKPDTWSYITEGRVWIDQNWGTHIICYLINKYFHDFGILTLKAVLISAGCLFAILASLKRGAVKYVSIILTGLAILCMRGYIDLRPNLMTLVLGALTLWLIYASREKYLNIYLAVLAVVLWGNIHGGFIFGMAMIFLWIVSRAVKLYIFKEIKQNTNELIHLTLAGIGTLVLPAILSPFGIINLTHPFLIANDPIWRFTNEWLPIWVNNSFGNITEYKVYMVIIFTIFLIRFICLYDSIFGHKVKRDRKHKKLNPLLNIPNLDFMIFDIVLSFVTIYMSVTSRRFVPLSLMLAIPVFSKSFWFIVTLATSRLKSFVLIGISCFAIAFSIYIFQKDEYPVYKDLDRNNLVNDLQVKMHFINVCYPHDTADFIVKNNISGNMFCDWRWEGFTRWTSPQVKVFMGGRAQQVYDKKNLTMFNEIFSNPNDAIDIFNSTNTNLISLPLVKENQPLLNTLQNSNQWVNAYNNANYIFLIKKDYLPKLSITYPGRK